LKNYLINRLKEVAPCSDEILHYHVFEPTRQLQEGLKTSNGFSSVRSPLRLSKARSTYLLSGGETLCFIFSQQLRAAFGKNYWSSVAD
jgi:hypothetical protein